MDIDAFECEKALDGINYVLQNIYVPFYYEHRIRVARHILEKRLEELQRKEVQIGEQ
jgi:hypothetical protein